MKLFIALVVFFYSSAFATPIADYPLGERLCYKILWGFIPVGHAVISCEEVGEKDAKLIRIRVKAKSNSIVSSIYPVDDLIDSYIDPESGLPVKVEKTTLEGNYECNDTLLFNRETLTAFWNSRSASIKTNYPICSDTLDVAAFLYALRNENFDLNKSKKFQIATDGVLHDLTITAKEKKKLGVGLGEERTLCTRFAVIPKRKDLFVRKIPGDIWVTDDSKKIMVKMKTKTPVGHVSVVFDAEKSIFTD